MTHRGPRDLVTVRCGPGGHWLAGLYRARDGQLWVRYEPRQMLDPEDFHIIPSPRPGGHIDGDRMAHALFLASGDESRLVVSCPHWRCNAQYPMWAWSDDLRAAAALAGRSKSQVVIAVPTASLRGGTASTP